MCDHVVDDDVLVELAHLRRGMLAMVVDNDEV